MKVGKRNYFIPKDFTSTGTSSLVSRFAIPVIKRRKKLSALSTAPATSVRIVEPWKAQYINF
jgi:hypothetical protein